MADLNFKSTIDRTMKVTKKYVDTLVEALDVNKQNKLTYEDDLEEFKKFVPEDAEVAVPMDVGIFCSVETLNLEIGKTYNLKTLVSTDIPMNLSENLTENVRSSSGKLLVEFTATAVKDEAASNELGQEIISLSYDYNDCAYDIIVYDKIMLQVDEEGNMNTVYSADHAVITIPFVAEYLEIGLKKHIKEELSNDFLKTYKFVTQEDKDNWNGKQDKIKNGVFIRQTPPPDTYGFDKVNLVTNILEDGLYMATNDLSFYEETKLLEGGAELYNGVKECEFHIYADHIFLFRKVEYSTEYCYLINLTTGITCCLDVNGGITVIYANDGNSYLGDVEKLLQYEEIVLELYESDRTGTVNMGTTSKEYQFNDAGFLFEENAIYHVVFEDLDGNMTEITGRAEYDGMFFGNRILAISEWGNPLIPETYLSSDGTKMIFNIDVKNTLEYNEFGKVTVLKVDYVSTEFLEEHRFITEEERNNWNNKSDVKPIYYDTKVKGMRLIDDSSLRPESDESYSLYQIETLDLIVGDEYKVNLTVNGTEYHGTFTAKDLGNGTIGAINFASENYNDIIYEEFIDSNIGMRFCLGHFQIIDKTNYENDYDENSTVLVFSLGEDENGVKDTIDNIEIEATIIETVEFTTELLKTHKLITDEEKNKLLTKSEGIIYYTPKTFVGDINNPGVNIDDAVYSETDKKYIIDYDCNFGLMYQHTYTAEVHFSDGTYVIAKSDPVWSDMQPTVFLTATTPSGVEVDMAFRDRMSSTSIVDFDKAYFEIDNIDEIVWIDLTCDAQQLTTQYMNDNKLKLVTEKEIQEWNAKASKAYVDEAIANASLGGGSDVSDSGVIDDSEFDDLISDTFGPEYIGTDE